MNQQLKISLSLLSLAFIVSCESNKTYEYIQINRHTSVTGTVSEKEDEVKIIEAISDSAAFLEAYQTYKVSEKIDKEMIEAMGSSASTPIKFKLINTEGKDIAATTTFNKIDSLKSEIEKRISLLPNHIKKSHDQVVDENNNRLKDNIIIDSLKAKELKPYFTTRKEEFSNTGLTWIQPKNAPKYVNSNALYCYFSIENEIPQNFRLRMQYYADDWLFINSVQFLIDETTYTFIPNKMERDNGDGGYIWEWFDEEITENDKALINALASGKNAKMKINGNQYHDIKTITSKQLLYINRSLEYYKALGGQY